MIKIEELTDNSCSDCLKTCDNLTVIKSKHYYDKIPMSYLCGDCLSLFDNMVNWQYWIAEPLNKETEVMNRFKKRNLTGVAKDDPAYHKEYMRKKIERGLSRVNWFLKTEDIEFLYQIMSEENFKTIDQPVSYLINKFKKKITKQKIKDKGIKETE